MNALDLICEGFAILFAVIDVKAMVSATRRELNQGKRKIIIFRNDAHLTNDKIKSVVQEWKKRHAPTNVAGHGSDFLNTDYETIVDLARKVKEVQESITRLLSEDEIADLETVFYTGRDAIFCEFYEEGLSRVKGKHKVNQSSAEGVSHLMQKTNFLNGEGVNDSWKANSG